MGRRKESLTSCNGTTNDTTNTGTEARRQNDEGERELLGLGFVDVGNQTESDTSTGG